MKQNVFRKPNGGFTLAELVVVMVTFGLVLWGAVWYLIYTVKITDIVARNTDAQNEARAMFQNIKTEASTAHLAELTDLSPASGPAWNTQFSSARGWPAGTLAFYTLANPAGGGTFTLGISQLDAGGNWTAYPSASAPLKFGYYDFDAKFFPSELNGGGGGPENVVGIKLTFNFDATHKFECTDEVYLSNLGVGSLHNDLTKPVNVMEETDAGGSVIELPINKIRYSGGPEFNTLVVSPPPAP